MYSSRETAASSSICDVIYFHNFSDMRQEKAKVKGFLFYSSWRKSMRNFSKIIPTILENAWLRNVARQMSECRMNGMRSDSFRGRITRENSGICALLVRKARTIPEALILHKLFILMYFVCIMYVGGRSTAILFSNRIIRPRQTIQPRFVRETLFSSNEPSIFVGTDHSPTIKLSLPPSFMRNEK